MSTRLRVLASMVIFVPVGAIYAVWGWATVFILYQHYAHRLEVCRTGWQYTLNGCSRFYPWLSWVELLVATGLLAAVAAALVRWTQFPLRAMARALDGFGPTNLAQRLDAGSGSEATRRLSTAINDMLTRVADGYEAQRRFAASASHELRTPLATQRALVEVSLSQPLTPDQQALLGRQLLATNERNVTVIEGLLTLAEAEQGLTARDSIALDTLVRDVVAAAQPEARGRRITVMPRLQPVRVQGERALVERMVANLVQNAVKYNVDDGRVDVDLTDAPPTLWVANTGHPVPPDQVSGLFEPFRRLAGDRLAQTDGAGLGLTIVRSIVGAHHGHLDARANPGGGLTVVVTLPGAGQQTPAAG